MIGTVAPRLALATVVVAAVAPSSPLCAQEWSLVGGFAARAEYNDNYFFTSASQTPSNPGQVTSPQSAFTASVIPFVTAARRTETSSVTTLLAVGANKVWGLSATTDYVSANLALDGSLREGRSTWTGTASLTRAPSLQNVVGEAGVVLGLAYTDSGTASGSYSYALNDRWTIGATAGGYGNRYESVVGAGSNTGTTSNNHGFGVGGNVGYAYSDRTQFSLTLGYASYWSGATTSDYVTSTLGFVHRFSPQLTVSATVGGFWTNTKTAQDLLVCPADPTLCDAGLVARLPVTTNDKRRDSGGLYGGNVSYALSERTQLGISLSEGLTPSSAGALSKTENASVVLSHQFSERLTGRLGASYLRTSFPAARTNSYSDKMMQAQIGVSYQLAERWKLDAGYQYARAEYSQNSSEPKSNVIFISVGYNWPGVSFTSWIGSTPAPSQGLPAAGPLSLTEGEGRSTRPSSGTTSSETSPFDGLTLP